MLCVVSPIFCVAHLRPTPRDHSILWRLLRPELVRQYPDPLSPDAYGIISATVADNVEQCKKIDEATQLLVEVEIPNFLENLLQRDYQFPLSEALGLDVPQEMHDRGINVRHLGLLRSLLWRELPGKFVLCSQWK
jgi:hypothetical protein